MKFTIKRTYLEKGTLGELTDEFGNHLCFTIERPKTGDHPCIPEGIYTASRFISPKHGQVWQLENVPGRTYIQFHIANWPHELLGCIAPGIRQCMGGGEPGVEHSADAFNEFMNITQADKFIVFTITS